MTDETLLEFPCEFPIKAFGKMDSSDDDAAENFAKLLFELINPFVEGLQPEHLSINPSSKGRFAAVTITITAQSKAQLDEIYKTLSDHEQVVMSL